MSTYEATGRAGGQGSGKDRENHRKTAPSSPNTHNTGDKTKPGDKEKAKAKANGETPSAPAPAHGAAGDANANTNANATIRLKVGEATARDLGRGLARLDPADIGRLNADIGDIVEIVGKRRTVAKIMPAFKPDRGQARVQIDGIARENAGAALDEVVELRVIPTQPAERVVIAPLGTHPTERDLPYIGSLFDGLPVVVGDRVRVALFGNRSAEFKVIATTPNRPVVVNPTSTLEVTRPRRDNDGNATHPTGSGSPPRTEGRSNGGGARSREAEASRRISYEDVGGLWKQLHRVREIIELPLRHPELFERLGIDAPKGVLLHGPPGCGKTLIARAVAQETDAAFYSINGPEIIHKFYGESEAALRKVFEDAARNAPSIIFLDEIDAIAPRREQVHGEVEKRVVAQLLGLMDGLAKRGQVMVIAATNLPNALDPALRRPGRFDREIAIPVPDREARRQILEVHSRGMPLAADVDVQQLASMTHGYVGADLEALCREAAMSCLRRLLPEFDLSSGRIPYESLQVRMEDCLTAYREIEPSAVREVFVEVPDVRWEDVGGLDALKQQLIEAVEWPLSHGDLFAQMSVRPPRGILLSGPPGCGKTLLAKAVASRSEANFVSVKGPALLSKYVGESERGVREVFRKAKQAAPCIIFFDEIDALVPTRGGAGGSDAQVAERVVGQFLAELDGVEDLGGVLVLAATNRPDRLDPAILRPGRFDLIIEVPPPDHAGRIDIFRIGLRDKPLAPGINFEELAQLSPGLSGAEIQGVCQAAARAVIRDAIAQSSSSPGESPMVITREHLLAALESQNASATKNA